MGSCVSKNNIAGADVNFSVSSVIMSVGGVERTRYETPHVLNMCYLCSYVKYEIVLTNLLYIRGDPL